MSLTIIAEPLTRASFAGFGDVIEKAGAKHHSINDGTCIRYHDLAPVQLLGNNACALINIFSPEPKTLPCPVRLVERHPLGSQAFIPLSEGRFLVFVYADARGAPVGPRAFVTNGRQGVSYRANIWHAPLIALGPNADFIVIDRGGDGDNLEEYELAEPILLGLPG